ncbi:DedA family protein [Candidatus Pacearchaeota archaeon]|nr:DedA family protein [Candidatus Pacearchaeota archaeon]
MINKLISIFLHLDENLAAIIQTYGIWTYLILFLIIFLETGLVIAPFLPGDSLLFAAGAFASQGVLNIFTLCILLIFAAIIGDTVNYWIGNFIGPKVFKENSKLLKRKYLIKTQKFYEKYGGKTIILARFIPIIRTFAPFVAGIGKMQYKKFLAYNIIGAIIWVLLFALAGFYFGNIPLIKDNFEIAIIVIIFISILPPLIEFIRHKFKEKKQNKQESLINPTDYVNEEKDYIQ